MADNRQLSTLNPDGKLAGPLPVKHSNGRNATRTFKPAQARLSIVHENDMNQLDKMVNHLAEQLEYL